VNVRETFVGDISGDGAARFLQTARSDGSASFVDGAVVGSIANALAVSSSRMQEP